MEGKVTKRWQWLSDPLLVIKHKRTKYNAVDVKYWYKLRTLQQKTNNKHFTAVIT